MLAIMQAVDFKRLQRKRAAAIMLICLLDEDREEKSRQRASLTKKRYTNKWLRKRTTNSTSFNFGQELSLPEENRYRLLLQMDEETFRFILDRVQPFIVKQDTHMRKAIPTSERLAITLRFLATGESFKSLFHSFHISDRGISKIVLETCAALYACMQEEFMKMPNTNEEWLAIASAFEERWNFPNCIGAMDGRHISIQRPAHSHTLYYNYEGFYSIILLALVDANLKFTYVDVGMNGLASDGDVFHHSSLHNMLQNGSLNLPLPKPLPDAEGEKSVPYIFASGEAFSLEKNVMTPLPSTELNRESLVYNNRLSGARRCAENAFGILVTRFRSLRMPLQLQPQRVRVIILAICVLHNCLRSRTLARRLYTPSGTIDCIDSDIGVVLPGTWRKGRMPLVNLQVGTSNVVCNKAREIQQEFMRHFNSVGGSVPWQNEIVDFN